MKNIRFCLSCILIAVAIGGCDWLRSKPIAPADLQATALADSVILLKWTDCSKGQNEVEVLESGDGGKHFGIPTRIPAGRDSVRLFNRKPDCVYVYFLRSCNGGLISEPTVQVSVQTPAGSYIVPPRHLIVEARSIAQIYLQWVNSAHDEDGYIIERKSGGSIWREISRLGAGVNSYLDENLTPNSCYYYRVRAYRSNFFSDYTNESNATTPASKLVKVLFPKGGEILGRDKSITIKWYADPSIGGVKIYFFNQEGVRYDVTTWVNNTGAYEFAAMANLPPSKTYRLRIGTSDPNLFADSEAVFTVQ